LIITDDHWKQKETIEKHHNTSTDLDRLDDNPPMHVLDAGNDDVVPSSCEVDVTGPPAWSAAATAVTSIAVSSWP